MTKAVQVSIDEGLLRRIDRDPEAKREGRSALIRRAVDLYLRRKERLDLDDSLRRAYGGRAAKEWAREIEPHIEAQAWPED